MSEKTQHPMTTPAAEIRIDVALVRRLLAAQHPDLASLPLAPVDGGWDNAMFRLGEDLAVRLPRRTVSAALMGHEQAWLPVLAPRLPLPIPAPVRTGTPAAGYPWHWSVVPWLPGEPGDLAPPAATEAGTLAGFLRALHVAAPDAAPVNEVRGVPLARRRDVVEPRLARLAAAGDFITPPVNAAWHAALDAPDHREGPVWVHGDLHSRNVLVRDGAISAIVDWGDLCGGDRATDLASVWMLLEAREARERAIVDYGDTGPGDWRRALGWAVSFGTVLLETGLADHPRHAAIGRQILRRVEEGPGAADLD